MAKNFSRRSQRTASSRETDMRIVGGRLRGSKFSYAGDPRVRPMKDRVREALFNLLGTGVQGTFALDLFGGTGALALEAISRGADAALIIERHRPTAKVIEGNIASLHLQDHVELLTVNTFHWLRTAPNLPEQRWVVFCCPPYRFFEERREEMLELIGGLLTQAPPGSLFAVEATDAFDFGLLPDQVAWDVRSYPPARVALATIPWSTTPST